MRKEIYHTIKERLGCLCRNAAGEYYMSPADMDSNLVDPVIKHIDLWNRNVEFIDEEQAWPRPAVFIEFSPIRWDSIQPGVEYRAEAQVILHIVTDWADDTAEDSQKAIDMLDLPDHIHDALAGLGGNTFREMCLYESRTNHNHGEIVENIETYEYIAIKSVGQ